MLDNYIMNEPRIEKIKKDEKLSLKSDTLSLFWVGSGSAFSKINYQTNLLILKKNTHLLVDCGTRCPQALWEYGCFITDIKNYLITHSHADHIGGIEEVALMSRYFGKYKPNMIITKDYEEALWHFSLKGGCAFNEKIKNRNLEFADFFNSINPEKILDKPREVYNIDFEDLNLKLFRTKHIPDSAKSWRDSFVSYGVLIDEKILFTSDTRHDPDLIYFLLEKYKTIQYIFHDCQLFNGGVHASYDELKTYPDEIKNIMYLAHYGDNYKDFIPQNDGFAGFTHQGYYYRFD